MDTSGVQPLIAAAIRRARKAKDLSQAQAAGQVGVSARAYGDWERSGVVPEDRRAGLATMLGLRPEDLIPGSSLDVLTGSDPELGEIRLLVPREALDALSPTERAEAQADLTARFLKLYREFRATS